MHSYNVTPQGLGLSSRISSGTRPIGDFCHLINGVPQPRFLLLRRSCCSQSRSTTSNVQLTKQSVHLVEYCSLHCAYACMCAAGDLREGRSELESSARPVDRILSDRIESPPTTHPLARHMFLPRHDSLFFEVVFDRNEKDLEAVRKTSFSTQLLHPFSR
jgi:hypothetical protein